MERDRKGQQMQWGYGGLVEVNPAPRTHPRETHFLSLPGLIAVYPSFPPARDQTEALTSGPVPVPLPCVCPAQQRLPGSGAHAPE